MAARLKRGARRGEHPVIAAAVARLRDPRHCGCREIVPLQATMTSPPRPVEDIGARIAVEILRQGVAVRCDRGGGEIIDGGEQLTDEPASR